MRNDKERLTKTAEGGDKLGDFLAQWSQSKALPEEKGRVLGTAEAARSVAALLRQAGESGTFDRNNARSLIARLGDGAGPAEGRMHESIPKAMRDMARAVAYLLELTGEMRAFKPGADGSIEHILAQLDAGVFAMEPVADLERPAASVGR